MTPVSQAQSSPKQEPSKADAIRTCEKKYPKDFKQKKRLTLAIVIGTIALSILSVAGLALSFTGLGTPLGITILALTPIAIIGIGILIKKIDDKTLYWSRDVAQIILQQKAEKARKEQEEILRQGMQLFQQFTQ